MNIFYAFTGARKALQICAVRAQLPAKANARSR